MLPDAEGLDTKGNLCEMYEVQRVPLCLQKVRMLHEIPSPPPKVKRLMKKLQKLQVKWLQKDKNTFAICSVFGVVFYWTTPVDLSRYSTFKCFTLENKETLLSTAVDMFSWVSGDL